MTLRHEICIGLVLLMPFPAVAQAVSLQEAKNEKLTFVLNNLSIIADRHGNSEVIARVYAVPELGECDGTPESCPQTTVYVAVSGFDEYPEQRLYLLPPAHGWKFIGWEPAPSASDRLDFLEFIMEQEVPAADPTKGWWTIERVKVRVSLDSATMDTLP